MERKMCLITWLNVECDFLSLHTLISKKEQVKASLKVLSKGSYF